MSLCFCFEKRPRKPEPKRAWLDAIMSKTRTTDAPPFASAASTPSSASFIGSLRGGASSTQVEIPNGSVALSGSFPPASMATTQHQQRWEPPHVRADRHPGVAHPKQSAPAVYNASSYPEQRSRGSQPPEYYQREPHNSEMYQDQLELDDSILAETMSIAFKQMVSEQDCCFIAKGICHLCGTNERHLIPVVNFCPEFHVNHSLCREHLRSMHRVRMEDIFAGKNRPTVSKRSLKCMVCSRSCPCSTCQLEKQHEISKYKRWLAGEREYELDSEDRSMGSDHHRMRAAGLNKKNPRSSGSNNSSMIAGVEYMADSNRHRREPHGPPQQPRRSSHEASYTEPRLLPSLQGGAKPPSHTVYRGAKRAAKEASSGHLSASGTPSGFDAMRRTSDQPSPLNPIHAGEPNESPSASHVMNCAESEKSLVRLLSSLNQEAAPSTQYPAESKQPRSFLGPPHAVPVSTPMVMQGSHRAPSPFEGRPLSLRPEQAFGAPSSVGSRPAELSLEKRKSGMARSDEEAIAPVYYNVPFGGASDAGSQALESSNRSQKRKRETNDGSRTESETSSDKSSAHSKRSGGSSREDGKVGRFGHADPPRKPQGPDKSEVRLDVHLLEPSWRCNKGSLNLVWVCQSGIIFKP